MTDEQFAAWPKCAVPACQLKSCLRLRSRFCWPHTPGTPGEARDSLHEEVDTRDKPPATAPSAA